MKLLGYRWFTGKECIGIVLVETDYDGLKAYIKKVEGEDEQTDLQDIMDWGTSFPVEEAKSLVGYKEI